MPIEVGCWRMTDCFLVEVNLATLTCWGMSYTVIDLCNILYITFATKFQPLLVGNYKVQTAGA